MKNSVKLFSAILLFFATHSFTGKAQTYISGFISANTTWNLAGSPYIVTGNALLSHGYTLTIDPGVIIKFDTNRTLQIDGELIAIGTPQSRITFTSLQSIPKAGDWGKVQFRDTSIDASFDVNGKYLSGSIMKYCDVLWGGGIGLGAIQMANATPYFTHCNIFNSFSAGLHGFGGYRIDSSAIKYCKDYGFYILKGCNIIIQADTLEGNLLGGISMSQGNGCLNDKTVIKDNCFISNSGQPALYTGLGNTSNILIQGNLFVGNSGVSGTLRASQLSNYLIVCNKFISNTSDICLRIDGTYKGSIGGNLFQNNREAIYIGSFLDSCKIFSNGFYTNSSPSGSICQFAFGYLPSNTSLFVENNDFKNNSGNNTIDVSILYPSNSYPDIAKLKHNNFFDPATQFELNNRVPFGSPNISADSNYWGGTSNAQADAVIYDYFDNGNLSVVYYQPILTSPVQVDTSCSFLFSSVPPISNVNYSESFPNPFSTTTTITFKEQLKDASLVMYNVFGQKVKAMEHINADRIRVQREDLASGIYIYEVVEKQRRVANGKLVIE